MLFDYLPGSGLLFVAWFTYTLNPVMSQSTVLDIGAEGQRWMIAVLEIDGQTASGDLIIREGGAFDSPPTPDEQERVVGTLSIDFDQCDHGNLTYAIDGVAFGDFEIIPFDLALGNSHDCVPFGVQ